MFQTEPILYLQSLASDGLTFFMEVITHTGYDPFLVGVIMLVMLGVSFRRGFLLLQLMMWTGAITGFLKDFFALPRPIYVDSNVQNLRMVSRSYLSEFTDMGAKGFLELLDRQVVETFRLQDDPSYGLPSGHVSSTTALWGGIALLFRNRVFRWIAPVMVILMALSRMYFGRHFLADVIGGAAVGGIILLVAHQLCIRCSLPDRFFERTNLALAAKLPNILFFCFMFLVPLLLILAGLIDGDTAGGLLGINTAFLLVMSQGFSDDSGTLPKRAARVLLGFLLFFVTESVVDLGIELTALDDDLAWVEFVEDFIPTFVTLWGIVTISVKLGLYKRESAVTKLETSEI